MYPIYDVYNNAYRNGGILNVTLDRHLIFNVAANVGSLTASINSIKTKYTNRANMNDVTMRISTVVSLIS